jgi:hypothetical protein
MLLEFDSPVSFYDEQVAQNPFDVEETRGT